MTLVTALEQETVVVALPRRVTKTWRQRFPAQPGRIALLWAASLILSLVDWLFFTNEEITSASSVLYLSGTSIFSGFLASWVLRLRGTTLNLVAALVAIDFCISLLFLIVQIAPQNRGDNAAIPGAALYLLYVISSSLLIWHAFTDVQSKVRRSLAIFMVIAPGLIATTLVQLDTQFWQLSAEAQKLVGMTSAQSDESDYVRPPEIEMDRLWESQASLLQQEQSKLRTRNPGTMNVYTIAIAGSGTQRLFSREARAALKTFSTRYGQRARGSTLLSNGGDDYLKSPLATRANLTAMATAVGEKADGKKDLVILYLASHGGRDAELQTDLPSYDDIRPISASTTAQALKQSGIGRRIIIISACYSGTWIPALANDDTIVLTAAAKDRTSFGCDDDRTMTVFGEAFLTGSLVKGVSLQQAFEDARTKIRKWEASRKETPSLPQAYVGKNMEKLWLEPAAGK